MGDGREGSQSSTLRHVTSAFFNVNLLSTLKCWEVSLKGPDFRLLLKKLTNRWSGNSRPASPQAGICCLSSRLPQEAAAAACWTRQGSHLAFRSIWSEEGKVGPENTRSKGEEAYSERKITGLRRTCTDWAGAGDSPEKVMGSGRRCRLWDSRDSHIWDVEPLAAHEANQRVNEVA